MKNYYNDIIRFVFNPIYYEDKEREVKNLIGKIAYSYVLCMCGLLLSLIIIAIFSLIIGAFSEYNLLKELHGGKFKLDKSAQSIFIIIVIAGPMIEELTYRLILKPTKVNISISLSIIFYIFILPDFALLIGLNNTIASILEVLITVGLFFILYFTIKNDHIKSLKGKHFKKLFYISSLLFGFMHILNFSPLSPMLIILSPIIVLPQLIYGLVFAYIRVRFNHGFFYALLLHILINLPGRLF